MKIQKIFQAKDLGGILQFISSEASRRNIPLYLIGGVVRDLLLKRDVKDVDLCVEGDAVQLAQEAARALHVRIVHHSRFRTATLFYRNGYIDMVTSRKESYPHSGALPIVEPSTLADDLLRRDFSINAMAVSLRKDDHGALIDHYQGLKDLKSKKIRILHEKSFMDDPTRILRAVRFEQRFGFKMEPQTLSLLKKALKRKLERNVSKERYWAEFHKMFSEPQCSNMIRRLEILGGLSFAIHAGKYKLLYLSKAAKVLPLYDRRNVLSDQQRVHIRLMAFVEGMETIGQLAFIANFPLTKEEQKVVLQNQERLAIITAVCDKGISPSGIAKLLRNFEREVVVYWYLVSENKANAKLKRFLERDSSVKLGISGNDIQRLGVSGSMVGDILDKVLDRKLDKGLASKVLEIKTAKEIIRKG